MVYEGCAREFYEPATDEKKQAVKEQYGLPERYVLYVGSMEERKNLLLAVKALRQMKEEVALVAVGKRTPYLEEVLKFAREQKLEHRLSLFYRVPFEDLPALYQMASAFVYPSRFEGFGIPVLEALVSRVPVVAATGSCLEEAGGPHSLYVHPDDDRQLALLLDKVLTDAAFRSRMVEEGLRYARRFDAERLTADLCEVYLKIR